MGLIAGIYNWAFQSRLEPDLFFKEIRALRKLERNLVLGNISHFTADFSSTGKYLPGNKIRGHL